MPAFGSFAGALPPVDLGPTSVLERIARRKKWVYLAIAAEDVWLSLAVVRTGYAASAFVFVLDRGTSRMLVDRALVGPLFASEVADGARDNGVLARFGIGQRRIAVVRRGSRIDVQATVDSLDLEVTIDESGAAPAIAAIANLGPGLVSGTEKRALAPVDGRLVIDGRSLSLVGATAGFDYTHGLLPRQTRWRWAFAMGKDVDGQPLGLNLTSGFVGEKECALFRRGAVHPLAEPAFTFDSARPEDPWQIEGEGIDLRFTPAAVHAQRTNLVVVRSRFLQPVGAFTGTLRVGEETLTVDQLPGVVEDQDVLW